MVINGKLICGKLKVLIITNKMRGSVITKIINKEKIACLIFIFFYKLIKLIME